MLLSMASVTLSMGSRVSTCSGCVSVVWDLEAAVGAALRQLLSCESKCRV